MYSGPVASLECYVCTKQEGNIEKCLSTVRTCDAEEDTCQTELRWGSESLINAFIIYLAFGYRVILGI